MLAEQADEKVYNLIQLIYNAKNYEGSLKDYEFSRRTMEEHWKSGYTDAVRTLRYPEVLERPEEWMGSLPSISPNKIAERPDDLTQHKLEAVGS